MSRDDLREALTGLDAARASAIAAALRFAEGPGDDSELREALADLAMAERTAGRAAAQSQPLRDWLLPVSPPEAPTIEPEPTPTPTLARVVAPRPAEKAADNAALETAVERLCMKFDGTGTARRTDVTLQDAVRALPPMHPIHDYASAVAEVERLEQLSDPYALRQWTLIPDLESQRQLLAFAVARSRRAQDAPSIAGDGALRSRASAIFPRLRAFSIEARPGWVNGLQRTHRPEAGPTWDAEAALLLAVLQQRGQSGETVPHDGLNPERALADLQAALDGKAVDVAAMVDECLRAGVPTDDPRLLGLLHGEDVALTGKRFKRLRKELRGFASQDAAEDDCVEGPVPADWVLRSATEGKRAVLVGGDRRTTANESLLGAFAFESLDWIDGLKHHQVDALAERVRNGQYDLVILLARFASHSIQSVVSPACAEADVLWVVVPRGYGATAVMRAIEAAHGVRAGAAGGVPGALTNHRPSQPELRGM